MAQRIKVAAMLNRTTARNLDVNQASDCWHKDQNEKWRMVYAVQ
jgi:hypothetical protein